jgi:hypothetical protein
MKLSNIFKKENKTVAKANVEKLEKNQLEKVVGGTDSKGGAIQSGAALLGGALPGGQVLSASVSSVSSSTSSGGGATAASYA